MSLLKKGNKKKGFTLMELLVVIAIIAVLAAVVGPNAIRAINRSKTTAVVADAKAVKSAAALYFDENPTAANLGTITTTLTPYLEKPLGNAPFGNSYTYDPDGYLIVPRVSATFGDAISQTISGKDAGTTTSATPATYNDAVHWATSATDETVTTAPAAGAGGFLAIRIHQ